MSRAKPLALGDVQALAQYMIDIHVHAMKPMAFAMTGALKVPASSTPLAVVTLGELMPTRL